MEETEEQHSVEEIVPKKSRHRKKLLYQSIKDQMEFYFSDVNISKDRFIAQLLQDDPYIDLSVFLQFNKVRRLTDQISDLCKAISKSEILQLSEDNLKVCRKTPIRVKENEDECTIYVERLPADAEHEWLRNIFTKFGPVDYVSIPRYKQNKMIKGFAFIEFDTPETAKKALGYFESIGCKLPTTMLPDQLASISSFESEKTDKKQNILNQFTTEVKTENAKEPLEKDENISKNEIEDSQTKEKRKKRKGTNGDAETNEVKKTKNEKPDVEVEAEQSDKAEETEKSNEGKKKKKDKQKREAKNETANEAVENEDMETKEIKDETEIQETGHENSEKADGIEGQDENKDEDVPEKKKRKRKKCKNNSNDLHQYGLQVLSKKDWKQLRNKYLNLQRQKMQSLKEHLHRSRFTNVQNNSENNTGEKNSSENNHDNKVPPPRFKFSPGAIVHIVLPETFIDAKKFKNDLRSQPGLQYIDLKVGSTVGYIRFSDNSSAKKFCESGNVNANMTILEGNEEKEYWDRLLEIREEKFKKDSNKQKQRGRDKLLRKAEKELGKHIRFENAE